MIARAIGVKPFTTPLFSGIIEKKEAHPHWSTLKFPPSFRQRGLGGKARILKDEEAFFKTIKSLAPAAVAQKEEDQARALKAVSM